MKQRDLTGRRFAVAGLGVSGLAACRAITDLGGRAVALDQTPADNPRILGTVDELRAMDVEVVTGWHGRLDAADFDVLVVSPGFPRSHPALNDMKGKVWGEVELAWRIARAPMAAVTGTNGKSTVTVLAWLILQAAGAKARLCGNISGSGYPETPLTAAALAAAENEVLAAEISSFQLETVSEFRPKSAGITLITPDHLDRHPSFDDYFQTKLRIAAKMADGDTLVVHEAGASPSPDQMKRMAPRARVCLINADAQGQAEYWCEDGVLHLGSGLTLKCEELPVPGSHFVQNVLMAWGLAAAHATLGPACLDAVREFKGLAHRLERVGERSGVLVVNNSMCTNPGAAAASILALGRRQELLMGGLTKNLSQEDFEVLRQTLAGSPHQVRLFGPKPEVLRAIIGQDAPHYGSLEDAFAAAAASAVSGEAIVLCPACASAEPFANFRERGDAFRQIAKEWLKT